RHGRPGARPGRGAGRGRLRRHRPARPRHPGRAAVPGQLPGAAGRHAVPRAVRGGDPGLLPTAGRARPAAGDPRGRGARLHHQRPHVRTHRPDAVTRPDRGRNEMSAPTEPMTTAPSTDEEIIASIGAYGYGWRDSDEAGAAARRGLDEDVVRNISALKDEPEWMLQTRLKSLRLFEKKPMPNWGADLSGIDFDNIKYFVRSTEKQATS